VKIIVLLISIALLFAAMYYHAVAQANVITKVEQQWFERLFTGNRAAKDNLNEEGLKARKQSNLFALAGFVMIIVFVFINQPS